MTKPITCRCGAQWNNPEAMHCAKCHRTFKDLTSFNTHQKYTRCWIDGRSMKNMTWTNGYWHLECS